jgi:cytochrome c5
MRWWSLVAAGLLAVGCGNEPESEPAHPGEQVYTRFCFSCHAAGVAGAPRVGEAAAWAPRIAKGREALIASTIEGIPPGMPPKGLCSSCSDEELAASVDYMLERSQ